MGRVSVKWTGCYPCLCTGEWTKFIVDGKDYTNLIPFNEDVEDGVVYYATDAGTFGEYQGWYFNEEYLEEFYSYEDGLEENEWIQKNDYWLKKITDDYELKAEIFEAFQKEDWRSGECGGCI